MSVFAHTNLRTDHSFRDAADTPEVLVERIRATGGIAAIADHETLAGGMDIYKANKGSKSGIGVGVAARLEVGGVHLPIRLHPRSRVGWQSLCRLSVRKGGAALTLQTLSTTQDVSLVVQGLGAAYPFNTEQTQDTRRTQKAYTEGEGLGQIAELFCGHFYIEDSRFPRQHREGKQFDYAGLIRLGAKPLAAAPVKFWDASRRPAWLSLRRIAATRSGITNKFEPGCHALSNDEMYDLFRDGDLNLLRNAETFAQSHLVGAEGRAPVLPVYKGSAEPDRSVAERAKAGLDRLGSGDKLAIREFGRAAYDSRLEYELNAICGMGFSSYFLIVSDFCNWARNHGISVGPGRGSGAGSLVARCLGITAVDPVANNLYFERFLNPDRVSLPDFDVDFASDRCGEVFRHIRKEYGGDHVARIATYAYMGGKSAIKELAAAYTVPFQNANAVTNMFPADSTIKEAMNDAGFRRVLNQYPAMVEVCSVAAAVEGLKYQSSLHAAGIVIAPFPVWNMAPVFRDEHGEQVTSYDMKSVEPAGLVKFDILALNTLSIIDEANILIESAGHPKPISIDDTVADDPAVFSALAAGKSISIFQFDEMQSALKQVQPKQFSDLVALNALYRPGPMANIPIYAERKAHFAATGETNYELPPPADLTRRSLAETYGIMVYQEQVMEIAKLCGGFSLGQADLLRRAIGKKIPEELSAARQNFVSGCVSTTGMKERDAEDLFGAIERFANYGFNKSHAVAYAHLGYVTAYYKVHHTAAWFAANLNRKDDTYIRQLLADESRIMGVAVLGPDINSSFAASTVEPRGGVLAIRLGLSFPKGLTINTPLIGEIVQARKAGGSFATLQDFYTRSGYQGSNSQLETMVWAGAFDSIEPCRTTALKGLQVLSEEVPIKRARSTAGVSSKRQLGLFAGEQIESRNVTHTDQPRIDLLIGKSKALPESHLREGREVDVLGFLINEEGNKYLIDRAEQGRFVLESHGNNVEMPVLSVKSMLGDAGQEQFRSGASGRIAVIGTLVGLGYASKRRTENVVTMNIILASHYHRHAFRISGSPDRLATVYNALSELGRSGSPAVLQIDWAIGESKEAPDIRVVGIHSPATVIFRSSPNDLRIKLRSKLNPQGPSDVFLANESRGILDTIAALTARSNEARGIVLITDGTTRRVDRLHAVPDIELTKALSTIDSVQQIYVGSNLVFDLTKQIQPTQGGARSSSSLSFT